MWLNGQRMRPVECLFCSNAEYIPEEINLPFDTSYYHCDRDEHVDLAHAVWRFRTCCVPEFNPSDHAFVIDDLVWTDSDAASESDEVQP